MRITYVSFCLFIFCINLFAQTGTNSLEEGIKLYQNADYTNAISTLKKAVKDSDNSKAWYFLGAAYLKKNDLKNSQKAFDNAVKLNSQNAHAYVGLAYVYLKKAEDDKARGQINKAMSLDKNIAEAHYILGVIQYRDALFKAAYESAEEAIKLNSKLSSAYLLKSEALAQSFGVVQAAVSKSPNERSELLADAITNLEMYLKLAPQADNELQQERLAGLKYFVEYYAEKDKQVVTNNDQTTPLKIIGQDQPVYTERARQAGAQGLIRLLVLFAKEGKVKYAFVSNRLNYGLTEEALKAAYKIKFVPATKNGEPISVVKTVEYRFSIY